MKRFFALLLSLCMFLFLLASCGAKVVKPENLYTDTSAGAEMTIFRYATRAGEVDDARTFYGIATPKEPIVKPTTEGICFSLQVMNVTSVLPIDAYYIVEKEEVDFLRACFSEARRYAVGELYDPASDSPYLPGETVAVLHEYHNGESVREYRVYADGQMARQDDDSLLVGKTPLSEKDLMTLIAMATKYQAYTYSLRGVPYEEGGRPGALSMEKGEQIRTLDGKSGYTLWKSLFSDAEMKTVIGTALSVPEGSICYRYTEDEAEISVCYLAPDGHLYQEYTQHLLVYPLSYCRINRNFVGYAISEETYDYAAASLLLSEGF